jgi:hypothetical protein
MADSLPLWLVLLVFAGALVAPHSLAAWLDRRAQRRRERQAQQDWAQSQLNLARARQRLRIGLPPLPVVRDVVRQSTYRERLVQGESFEEFIAVECGMARPEGL